MRFIQAKLSAANLYSLTVAAFFIYLVGVNLLLTQASEGMRMSVCGAEYVVSYGPTAAFFDDWFLFVPRPFHVPFLYQAASVILVQLLKWRYGSGQAGERQIGRNATVTEVY